MCGQRRRKLRPAAFLVCRHPYQVTQPLQFHVQLLRRGLSVIFLFQFYRQMVHMRHSPAYLVGQVPVAPGELHGQRSAVLYHVANLFFDVERLIAAYRRLFCLHGVVCLLANIPLSRPRGPASAGPRIPFHPKNFAAQSAAPCSARCAVPAFLPASLSLGGQCFRVQCAVNPEKRSGPRQRRRSATGG